MNYTMLLLPLFGMLLLPLFGILLMAMQPVFGLPRSLWVVLKNVEWTIKPG